MAEDSFEDLAHAVAHERSSNLVCKKCTLRARQEFYTVSFLLCKEGVHASCEERSTSEESRRGPGAD